MAVVVYRNLREGQLHREYAISRSLLHGAWMLIISELVALPFTPQFKSMVSGRIALAEITLLSNSFWLCVGISADSVHCFCRSGRS